MDETLYDTRGEALIGGLLAGLHQGRADLIEPDSFSIAITDGDGTLRWADAAFSDLVGEPAGSAEGRRLCRAARDAGVAAGLLGAARGSVVVEARSGKQSAAWPICAAAAAALSEAEGRLLFVAFAPSRAPQLTLAAARTLGLSPREADLAAALMEAPSLEVAALRAGMSLETAKDTLSRAGRRLGVRGASELVGRVLDVACGAWEGGADLAAETLGLTAAEGRVAEATAEGRSVLETARSLGLTEGTVKGHRKTIFAKTGAARDRDLRRLFIEAGALATLKSATEVVVEERAAGERLRVVARPGARRAAFIDYGPASGRLLFVMHGFSTGRRLPELYLKRLRADGWRPVVLQRPGFGLTDPARSDFLAESADDMSAVVECLGGSSAAVLARDGGVATAIAFAERNPAAFAQGVVVNPKSTRERPSRGRNVLANLSRLLLKQPALIAVIADGFRRRTATAQTRALMQRLYAGPEGDRFAAERPDILDHVIRDTQAMIARTTRGPVDELRLFAEGWRLPAILPGGPWRAAWGAEISDDAEMEAWTSAGAETSTITGLGFLGAYTHTDALADLLTD